MQGAQTQLPTKLVSPRDVIYYPKKQKLIQKVATRNKSALNNSIKPGGVLGSPSNKNSAFHARHSLRQPFPLTGFISFDSIHSQTFAVFVQSCTLPLTACV